MVHNLRRRHRAIFFVCAAVSSSDNQLIIEDVIADSLTEAAQLFQEKFLLVPQEIKGPFYKKRKQIEEPPQIIRFSKEKKLAQYENWNVRAFILIEPEHYAYLIFLSRIDNKITSSIPKGTHIVPLSQLRLLDENKTETSESKKSQSNEFPESDQGNVAGSKTGTSFQDEGSIAN